MTELEWERFAAAAKEQHKEYDRRLRAVEDQAKNLTDLVQSVSAMAQKQMDMDAHLKEIKADVKNINLKPAKRWDAIVNQVLLAAVGALIAYIAVQLGLR